MARKYVVTGTASGMGRAAAELLRRQGHEVIGLDLRDAEVTADLSTADGRAAAVAGLAEATGGTVDALIHCAGISAPVPKTISVNYFGAVAVLEGLRPMLARGKDPRAVVVTSYAATMDPDPELVAAALAGDEARALEIGEGIGFYAGSKAALSHWCRAAAITPEWAGCGILLNTVAPGMVDTPMIAVRLATRESYEEFKQLMPLPVDRPAKPAELAELFAFLASPANSYIVGQQIYADGGTEAVVRGASRF